MIVRTVLISAMACVISQANSSCGKVEVDWISSSATCEPGKPLLTAIRMIHGQGWHSYWINPGEAGMKTRIAWKLPPGWHTSGLKHPVPLRFVTGELVGFGYEGTVLFPVLLTPPAGFTSPVRLEAMLSWLACSEDGCVPGEASLILDLAAGPPNPGPEAAAIQAVMDRIPRPGVEALRLDVADKGANLLLKLSGVPEGFELSRYSVFPVTSDAIDPRAVVRFSRSATGWTAEAPKSPYVSGPLRELSLVLAGTSADAPLELRWNAP